MVRSSARSLHGITRRLLPMDWRCLSCGRLADLDFVLVMLTGLRTTAIPQEHHVMHAATRAEQRVHRSAAAHDLFCPPCRESLHERHHCSRSLLPPRSM